MQERPRRKLKTCHLTQLISRGALGAWTSAPFCFFALCAPAFGDSASIPLDPANPSSYWMAGGSPYVFPVQPKTGMRSLPQGTIGWFDFAFSTPKAGWRKLIVEAKGGSGRFELAIDAPSAKTAFVGPYRPGDWVWIPEGAHRLRVGNNVWTGFPESVTGLRLEAVGPSQPGAMYLVPNTDKPVSAVGACAPVRFLAGGSDKTAHLLLLFTDAKGTLLSREAIEVAPSAQPQSFERAVPCGMAGTVTATLRMGGGPLLGMLEAKQSFTIFDTSPAVASFEKGRLALSIDAATRDPDHQSGSTETVERNGMRYRESSDKGALAIARGETTRPASWFAYDVKALTPGKAYAFQVDYPDDQNRVFIAAFRQAGESSYPISLGMETGGVWPLSNTVASRSAFLWPTTSDARVIVYNYFDEQKAPLARLSFYEVKETIKPRATPFPNRAGLRDVAYYAEEGLNFKMLVGGSSKTLPSQEIYDRYARLAAASGGSLLIPTLVVYADELYPSRINLTFQEPGMDGAAAFLLSAKKYGLSVMPELAPRADEVMWTVQNQDDAEKRLLISKTGEKNLTDPKGNVNRPPTFNPLDPIVRKWYVDMVAEVAERYKGYANFAGVQLRMSDWQNPALNNLVSLDWGYDKETVARFLREKNIVASLPLADNAPESAKARYAFLTQGALRETWIAWRCEKIGEIMRDLVARVRKARPDLRVNLTFFALSAYWQPDAQSLRERGLDLELLQKIDGLVLVDSRFQHGAKEQDKGWQSYMRSGPVQPKGVEIFAKNDQRPSTLYPMQYLELTDAVTPNAALGWSTASKSPWISAASEPTGRLRLARYAELVGLYDVAMIGDGGNGYVFADEALRDFFVEFRSLPRRPFEKIPNATADVVVRRSGDVFYAVNLANERRRVEIEVPSAQQVVRLTTGEKLPLANERVTVDLEPYQLRGFSTRAGR